MALFATGNPYNATTGQLTFVAGCDYKAAEGNGVVITNPAGNWPTLSGAVYLVVQNGNFPPQQPVTFAPGIEYPPPNFPQALIAPIAGTIAVASGTSPPQEVTFDLPAAATMIRPCPTPNDLYSFAVYAVLTNGDVVPLLTGPCQALGVA